MIESSASVDIDCPIDEVFHYTNDNVAEWSITVVEDEVINETPDHVGTTFRSVTETNGNRMEFQGEVIRYEPPHLSAVRLNGKLFDIDAVYMFEDISGRTRVTQKSYVYPKSLIMKIIFGCCGWLMSKGSCDAAQKEMQSLKKHCEQQGA
ncbi:MAG: SRPBCC family protein [Fuerstiella sp.]